MVFVSCIQYFYVLLLPILCAKRPPSLDNDLYHMSLSFLVNKLSTVCLMPVFL